MSVVAELASARLHAKIVRVSNADKYLEIRRVILSEAKDLTARRDPERSEG